MVRPLNLEAGGIRGLDSLDSGIERGFMGRDESIEYVKDDASSFNCITGMFCV